MKLNCNSEESKQVCQIINEFDTHRETYIKVFNVELTDRMGIRIKAKTTHNQDITITYTVGDGYGAWLNNPNKIRHSQLRALNEDTSYQHIDSTTSKNTPVDNDALALKDSSS